MQSTPLTTQVDAVRRQQDALFDQMGGVAPSLEQQRQMAAEAKRLESVFSALEMTLPDPGPVDSPDTYRARLLAPLQKFSPQFRRADLRSLAAAGGLRGIDAEIIRSATKVADDPLVGSFRRPGQLREIRTVDPGGDVHTEFRGNPLSWMQAFAHPMQVAVRSWGQK